MGFWFKAAWFAVCLAWSGAAAASSCLVRTVLFNPHTEVFLMYSPVLGKDAAGNLTDAVMPDRYQPVTPEQSAQYYYKQFLHPLADDLQDGEMLFMGRFALKDPNDAERLQDLDRMIGAMRAWHWNHLKTTGRAPLVGTSRHSIEGILAFDGHVQLGGTWVPFSTEQITYITHVGEEDGYGPFPTTFGRPVLERFEFGVLSLEAIHKQYNATPVASYVPRVAADFTNRCQPAFRRHFRTEDAKTQWEDSFKTCALRGAESPEGCWRRFEFAPNP